MDSASIISMSSYEAVGASDGGGEASEPLVKPLPPAADKHQYQRPFRRHPAVKRMAYRFDGRGQFRVLEWDLSRQWDDASDAAAAGTTTATTPAGFSWFHVEIPRSIKRPAAAAQYLIDVLCPPLKLQDVLALVSNGPFCGSVDGALTFRVNSAGPPSSKFTHKIAARVTRDTVISVSLGRVSRLEFANNPTKSLLTEVPRNEPPRSSSSAGGAGGASSGGGGAGAGPPDKHLAAVQSFRRHHSSSGAGQDTGVVIQEHVLEFLLTMNHPDDLDSPVPTDVSKLLIHIVDTHIDQLQDIVIKLEMELDEVENQLDTGNYIPVLSVVLSPACCCNL